MAALLLALTAPALAGALGNPARTTEGGLIEAQIGTGLSSQALALANDPSCVDYCAAKDQTRGPSLRVNLRPADFLGLWAEGSWGSDYLEGTDHLDMGFGMAAGAHLAVPGRGLRPAASARVRWMSTAVQDEAGLLVSENRGLLLEGALLGVVGEDTGGANGWFGPIATVYGGHDVSLYYTEEALRLRYTPYYPVGAVAGGELISDPLQEYLKGRSVRLVSGMEVRMIDAWGVSAWFGLAY